MFTRILVPRCTRCLKGSLVLRTAQNCHLSTDNVTQVQYSGGQATEGQGGFYGSGGARVVSQDTGDGGRSQLLALAQDVEKILHTMDELDQLESLLRSESDAVSSKSIELKAAIKKLMTSAEVLDALNRLEVEGAPVWGLSSEEREMIIFAREKMNEV